MTELHWLTAGEIVAAYAARKLSPVELLEALLARIAKLDPKLNAFTRLDAGFAMDAARLAERELFAGRSRGRLHGVPIGIKDIFDVAGLPTTCNSKFMLDHVATRDAHVVARLRAAGAIILGKLGTHEFAIGGPSFDLPFPPPRNPWNPDHHPGGSSSGSGAGIAAGLFPIALGSDSGGSVRHPASVCGITGLKPTYGLVSRSGVAPLSFTVDHVGPMARSAADVALLLDTIAGHDPRDPGSVASDQHGFGDDLSLDLRGMRIGFVRHFHEQDLTADPEVLAALEQVAATFAAEGATIVTIVLPQLNEFAGVCRVILGAEVWPIHAERLRSRAGDYGQLSRQRLMAGAFLSAARLPAGEATPTRDDRRDRPGVRGGRYSIDRERARSAVPDRRRGDARGNASVAGVDAVQCHGPSRRFRHGWTLQVRIAAFGAVGCSDFS